MLKINPKKKPKIMIFQKHPRKSVDINFNIGTEPIEIAQEYTYLGTRLTSTGNFTLALEHLTEIALHAFSSTRKHTLLNRLSPNTASKIFDTTIFPILTLSCQRFFLRKTHFLPLKWFFKCYVAKCHLTLLQKRFLTI